MGLQSSGVSLTRFRRKATEDFRYSKYASSWHMALLGVSDSFATGRPLTYCSLMTMFRAVSAVSLDQKVPMPKETLVRSLK